MRTCVSLLILLVCLGAGSWAQVNGQSNHGGTCANRGSRNSGSPNTMDGYAAINSLIAGQTTAFYEIFPGQGTDCVELQTLPLPQLFISPVNTLICAGENVSLNAGGAQTYSWLSFGNTHPLVAAPQTNSTYSVQGIDVNNCMNTASIAISVDRCTGVGQTHNYDRDIKVYPNPNSGNFAVTAYEKINLMIFNGLGQLVKLLELNSGNGYKVSGITLSKGVYYCISENGFKQKIIVE